MLMIILLVDPIMMQQVIEKQWMWQALNAEPQEAYDLQQAEGSCSITGGDDVCPSLTNKAIITEVLLLFLTYDYYAMMMLIHLSLLEISQLRVYPIDKTICWRSLYCNKP